MNSEVFSITPQNMLGYLVARGLARDERNLLIRELGGGVSNTVLLIEGPDRLWVAKQSLGKLRVEDDWRSERERIYAEADSLQALGPVLGDCALPKVIHIDRENYLFIMTAAPAGSVVWKKLLLEGRADRAVARQAGALLARMINASRADPQLRKRFQDQAVYDQLRIDPYYRTTALRHPDMRPAYEALEAESWNIRTSLVHGDYSPKNILVQENHKIFLIDFEVVHWGDPAFDSGFMLNHLFLKALFQPHFARLYLGAAWEFWKALVSEVEDEGSEEFEAMTVRHLGGLMLARIDGKSPVEYIRDEATKAQVRQVAKRILRERPRTLAEVSAMVLKESGGA